MPVEHLNSIIYQSAYGVSCFKVVFPKGNCVITIFDPFVMKTTTD